MEVKALNDVGGAGESSLVLRSYLDTRDGLCMPMSVMSAYGTMTTGFAKSEWFGVAASMAMRGIRVVTDDKVYGVPQSHGEVFGGYESSSGDVNGDEEEDDSSSSSAAFSDVSYGSSVASEDVSGGKDRSVYDDPIDVFQLDKQSSVAMYSVPARPITVQKLVSFGTDFLRSEVVRKTVVVLTAGKLEFVEYREPKPGELTLACVLATARVLYRGAKGLATPDQLCILRCEITVRDDYKRQRLRASSAVCDRVGPHHVLWRLLLLEDRAVRPQARDSAHYQLGFCLDQVLPYGASYGAWPDLKDVLWLPQSYVSLRPGLVCTRQNGNVGMWHVEHVEGPRVPEGSYDLYEFLVNAASCLPPEGWPDGSLGRKMSRRGDQEFDLLLVVHFPQVFGGVLELNTWLSAQAGADLKILDDDLRIASYTTAGLSSADKIRHGMLEAIGDATLRLVFMNHGLERGMTKQGAQAIHSEACCNPSLSATFVRAVPHGLVFASADINMSKAKSSADAIEVFVALVLLSGGVPSVQRFMKSLGILVD